MRWIVLILLVLILLAGCVDARSGQGAECARNSDCAAPLVCALENCRVECNSTRDCPIGAGCVLAPEGFGVCQLEDETRCDSRCPTGLQCRFGQCVNTCDADDVCPPGTECRDDDGVLACFDPLTAVGCERDGDCRGGLVCISDRCVRECLSDRDCRFGRGCDPADGRCKDPGVIVVSDAAVDASIDAPLVDVPIVPGLLCPVPSADVSQVCVGSKHGCALLVDGRIFCWGTSTSGQLGSVGALSDARSPLEVTGISDATRVACGANHTCAIHSGGQLSCWGLNSNGQVGSPMMGLPRPMDENYFVPQRVGALSDVRDVALSEFSSCALEGTAVWCWGDSSNNSLGNGETASLGMPRPTPQLATDVPPAVALSRREQGGTAITTTGTLFLWGENLSSIVAPAFTDVIDVDEGEAHMCLLRSGGEVWCAGANRFDPFMPELGVLADPARGDIDPVFSASVAGISTALQVAAGRRSTCARLSDGTAECWGRNELTLGVGDAVDRAVPTAMLISGNITDVALDFEFGCAVIDARAHCWGVALPGFRTGLLRELGNTFPAPLECMP